MTEAISLVPVEQKEVEFYEDTIMAVRLAKEGIYIPIKPICDLLGVDWGGQYRRIQRDSVLSEEVRRIDVTSTRRGTQPMICLPLDFISGFLFGLNPDRVKPELRDRIIRYQRECYKVLSEAFQEGRLTADPTFDELLESDTPAVQAYRMITAMMQLARQQVLLEARLDSQAASIEDHEKRLEYVESQLGDASRTITEEQAVQISQAVRAIGILWSKKTKSNQYGAVYGRLYQQFNVNSYKLLPSRRFEEAMKWLNEWLQSLQD